MVEPLLHGDPILMVPRMLVVGLASFTTCLDGIDLGTFTTDVEFRGFLFFWSLISINSLSAEFVPVDQCMLVCADTSPWMVSENDKIQYTTQRVRFLIL